MFYLLRLQDMPILDQLKLEEALLRLDDRPICILSYGSTPAIVMGISQKVPLVVDQKKQEAKQIPILRRFSGGGTVIVDQDTCFVTFMGNAKQLNISHNPDGVHCHFSSFYKKVFEGLPFSYLENDYRLKEKKIGGNAQYFRKDRFLHHTSFLFDWKKEHMECLLQPPKMPSYRESRSHEEFITRINGHFPSKKAFLDRVEESLKLFYEVKEITLDEVKPLLYQEHRKTANRVLETSL